MAKPGHKPENKLYQTQEFNELKQILDNLKQEMRDNMPLLREEIEEIITLKNRNGARIEQTLDTLLNYAQLGVGDREFNMLNEYYKGIDKEGYNFYRKLYDEFKGED